MAHRTYPEVKDLNPKDLTPYELHMVIRTITGEQKRLDGIIDIYETVYHNDIDMLFSLRRSIKAHREMLMQKRHALETRPWDMELRERK